jgi:light-regulated signal transduction histidine kinase (bacteriophytochrome)
MSNERDFDIDWQRFPALMAHDLKGPVGNMVLYTNLALEEIEGIEKLDPDAAEILKKVMTQVHDSAEKMLFQVQSWVDAHFLMRGVYQKKEELFDIQLLIEQVVEAVKSEYALRSLKIQVQQISSHKVLADSQLLRNSLKNLLFTVALFASYGDLIKLSGHVHEKEAVFDIDYPASPGMERVLARLRQDLNANRHVDTTEGVLKTGVFGMIYTNLAITALQGSIHLRDTGHRAAFGIVIPAEAH